MMTFYDIGSKKRDRKNNENQPEGLRPKLQCKTKK